ncbi:MAG TPA: DUF885 domain-containing protein [Caulobacteraceae bacterium]|jgi:uncharacterized protein (DUF885 family)
MTAEFDEATLMKALAVIERVWAAVEPSPFTTTDNPFPPSRLPEFSEAAAAARAERGKRLMAQIDEVNADALPLDVAATLAVGRKVTERWSKALDWYWLVFDPLQVGFFAMFAPTVYGGGFLLSSLGNVFATQVFASEGDVERYLALVCDYARMLRQFDVRTRGQFDRGIVMPKAAIDPSVAAMTGLRGRAPAILSVAAERLAGVDGAEAARRIEDRIQKLVFPAFDDLIAYISAPAYRDKAPEAVGLTQYPGGAEVYAELVRMHLTMDMSIDQVHQAGLTRMQSIREQMQALMDAVGFAGDPLAYLDAVKQDPRWRAEGETAITEVFQRYIDRIAPHIEANFNFMPKAAHGVAALPAALEGAMTFGYYDMPKKDGDVGRYIFNTKNLSQGPLMNIAALNFHELVPGHHFHLASQRENTALHPLRKGSSFNAFNEGWAEYAATLAGELGMYAEPEEKFGRLVMDAFLTCRLVVDTGMNAMGWSLEQARDYMRANAFMPETEILSESVRYSCDIPGQSLAYKLGDTYLLELRREMKEKLGNRFDLKAFHDAVLAPGGLPLPLVRKNVEAATQRILEAAD